MRFTPFPELTTHRLLLRQLKHSDEQVIFQLRSDERVNQFLDRPPTQKPEEAGEFIAKIRSGIRRDEWVYWAISLKESSTLVGTICLWNFSLHGLTAEVGYELLPQYQKMGIMNEALTKVIEYAFQTLGLRVLEAFTHEENLGSLRLLEKHHFRHEPERVDEANSRQLVYTLSSIV